MSKNINSILFLLLFLISTDCLSQSFSIPEKHAKNYNGALENLDRFHNDVAVTLLDAILKDLQIDDLLNTSFGLEVQLRKAEALEKDHQDEVAIEQLINVVELCQGKKEWIVLANAYLSLARMHEKLGSENECLRYLDLVRDLISEQELQSLYPRYAIRRSSYHRIYDNLDSAKFFAEEVLRTASKFELLQDWAVGHLLLGMIKGGENLAETENHYKLAGKIWRESGDFSGYQATLANLSRLYLRNKMPRKALEYNDSTLLAADEAIKMGHDQLYMIYSAYKSRANIYKELNMPDSALYYLDQAYVMEMKDMRKRNVEKIIEVDAKYNDKKKEEKISQQDEQIKFEKERKNLIGIIFFVGLVLSMFLLYNYLQLRKALHTTERQALQIESTNKELSESLQRQLVLQGEVHHRVKNNLQIIISLLELQSDEFADPRIIDSFETMSNRIYSMAAIHDILYQQKEATKVNISDYIENLSLHFSNMAGSVALPKFDLDIEDFAFNLETSMPLGIMLTELITNSIKYASLPGKILSIGISLKKSAEGFKISYKDNGPGFPSGKFEEREGGLGSYLLSSMVRQLDGQYESSNSEGARVDIFFKKKN